MIEASTSHPSGNEVWHKICPRIGDPTDDGGRHLLDVVGTGGTNTVLNLKTERKISTKKLEASRATYGSSDHMQPVSLQVLFGQAFI